jgi:hypothetical protein
MRNSRAIFTAIAVAISPLAISSAAIPASSGDETRDALKIGKAIISVDKALDYELPDSPTPAERAKSEALVKAAVEAGQTTLLYPWVNARIVQEITLAQNQLRDTQPDEKTARKLKKRIEYLQHLKLLIDAPL